MAVQQSQDTAESQGDGTAGGVSPPLKLSRSLVLDVAAAALLAAALLFVRGFDAIDRLPVVEIGEAMPKSAVVAAESGAVAIDEESDRAEGPEPDPFPEAATIRSDTSLADTPSPRRYPARRARSRR